MTQPRFLGRTAPGAPTLGAFTTGQLVRLCDVAGLDASDAELYARVLAEALGPVADRPLDLPPPSDSFLSDDHTPVEFSLAFQPDAPPTLRVLVEPGAGAGSLAESGRTGLRFLRAMARRWDFATDRLDELEDLFFPPSPQGAFALWCALELRPGGVPKVKVYLNPAASGQERSAETVREALRRLGHRQAFTALPQADRHLFFALDLGDWEEPRVKVYLAHQDLSAAEAGGLSRTGGGPGQAEIQAFFRAAAGYDADLGIGDGEADGHDVRLGRRPVQSCHAFTETASGLPSGFTLYVPVRDYVRHDGDALERAVAVLRRQGVDAAPLAAALAAVTSRRPQDGTGLIAYLALADQRGKPPRVTAYISSEAYRVRPPAVLLPAGAVSGSVHRERMESALTVD
ncbi:tryptophan dimethylallyltransferase family protein [Streptomyces sp. NPDC002088]|uniref:tryptophan dimethylallyltransferase family protein n=1 Tax=Streptomyces sp. NPDC002088 TaxID=3154665 RepID=UPI0033322456